MDIMKSNLFPYLEGLHMFNKKDVAMTISHVSTAKLSDFQGSEIDKHVIYFQETDKGLVLNKTNVKMLIKLIGRETDDWKGKKIQIGHEWVKAFGKTTHGIRVRDIQLNDKVGNGKKTNGKKPARTPEETRDPAEIDLLAQVNARCGNYYNDLSRLLNAARRHNPDIDPDNLADPANVALIVAAAVEYANVPPELDASAPGQAPLFDEPEPVKYE